MGTYAEMDGNLFHLRKSVVGTSSIFFVASSPGPLCRGLVSARFNQQTHRVDLAKAKSKHVAPRCFVSQRFHKDNTKSSQVT